MTNPDDMLKACPFCGHGDELEVAHHGAADEWWWEVFCDHCCTYGPSGPTEAEAIAAWNQRASIQPADDAVVERVAVAMYIADDHSAPWKSAANDAREYFTDLARAALAALAPQGEKAE